MKSKDAPVIACLRQPDYLSNLKRYFPHLFHAPSFLIYSTKYYVHQASNGHIFHVAFQEELRTADIALTDENHCVLRIRSLKCVTAIQGVRGNTLYLLRAENIVLRATIVDGRSGKKRVYKPLLEVLETTLVSVNSPSFNIASSPYRAVYNDKHVRIVPLECNPIKTLGTVITDFKKHFADTTPLAKNSVIHRGYLIFFEFGEERSCRKVDDRVIIVTSPLFGNFISSILHLVYSMDHFNYVYLFVPTYKTLLIVDPTMLRFSENELLFKDEWKFEESDSNLINLVGISDGIVTIGFPGFDFTPEVQCRQIINYYVWRGKIPRPIYWTTVNRDVSEKEDITNGCKENNPTDKLIYEAIQTRLEQGIARSKTAVLANNNEKAKPETAASWNVDVPAFVPRVIESLPKSNQDIVSTQNEERISEESSSISIEDATNANEEPFDVIKFAEVGVTDEQTQTEEDELASLKRDNKILENQLSEQQDRVEKLRRRNEKLKEENEDKRKEQSENLEKLRTQLQLLKESNNILEKSICERIPKAHESEKEEIQDSTRIYMNDEEITKEVDQKSEESEAPDWDDVDVDNGNCDDDLTAMVEATAREFEERCGNGNKPEDDISAPWIVLSPSVKPIGSEKKRKEKEDFILNNISSFVPDWSSSLAHGSNLDGSSAPEVSSPMPCPSSILPPLARPSTPFGALFSGDNFTAWSKTETTASGWGAIKGIFRFWIRLYHFYNFAFWHRFIVHSLQQFMKSTDAPEIACLRQPDYLSNLEKYFPHLFHAPSFLIYSTKYYAHQATNGNIFHVAFQEALATASVTVTDQDYGIIKANKIKCVGAVRGVRDSTLYLLSTDNQVITVMLTERRSKKYQRLMQQLEALKRGKAPVVISSLNLESCPYQAIYNDSQIRILSLESVVNSIGGTVITNKKHFHDKSLLAKNAVVHRGYVILFVHGDVRSCRKADDRIIIVTSPLLKNFNSSILHLVYAIDDFNFVYLLVPGCKTLLIVDPTMLRFCEYQLLFGDSWKVEQRDYNMVNLIGVRDRAVSIGFPEYAFTPHVQCRQLINYYVWRGTIPKPITWTTFDSATSEEDAKESRENNANNKLIQEALQARLEQGLARSKLATTSNKDEKTNPDNTASWNVDVPAFVPKVREPLPNEKPALVPTQKEVISREGSPSISNEDATNDNVETFEVIKFAEVGVTDQQTQTEEDELASLKRDNKILENQLNEKQDRVEKLRRRNEELKAENEEKRKEQYENLHKLRMELQLLKENNDIMEKNVGEPIQKATDAINESNEDIVRFDMSEVGNNSEADQDSEESEAPDWDDVDVDNGNCDDDLTALVEATAREFEERCGSGIKNDKEDDIGAPWIAHSPSVKPIGSEKKRKEKEDFILNNISSFVPDWSSSLAQGSSLDGSNVPEAAPIASPIPGQPSSILPSLARPSTPFGALFSGENFTAWSKTETSSSGWDTIKGNNKGK